MIDRLVVSPRLSAFADIERPPYAVVATDPRVDEMRRHVAARLARVCAGLTDAQFARLVMKVTMFRLRWALPVGGSADRAASRHRTPRVDRR
jgi:hypothetical protein